MTFQILAEPFLWKLVVGVFGFYTLAVFLLFAGFSVLRKIGKPPNAEILVGQFDRWGMRAMAWGMVSSIFMGLEPGARDIQWLQFAIRLFGVLALTCFATSIVMVIRYGLVAMAHRFRSSSTL